MSIYPGREALKKQSAPNENSIGFILGLVWTGFSLIFFTMAGIATFNEWQMQQNLDARGQLVQGQIADRDDFSDTDGDSYYLTYRYRVAGQIYENEDSVNYTLYDNNRIGDVVSIIYDPQEPQQARLEENPPITSWFIVGVAAIALLFVTIGIVMVAYFGSRWRTWQALKQNGRQVSAKIMETWVETDSDGDDTYYVAYGFALTRKDGSQKQFYKIQHSNQEKYSQLRAGDSVQALVLMSDPERNYLLVP